MSDSDSSQVNSPGIDKNPSLDKSSDGTHEKITKKSWGDFVSEDWEECDKLLKSKSQSSSPSPSPSLQTPSPSLQTPSPLIPSPSPDQQNQESSNYHSNPMFILNRNGLSRDELWDVFESICHRDYPNDEDLCVTWVNIFGNGPEVPHAFVILSRGSIMNEMRENGEISYTYDTIKGITHLIDEDDDDTHRTVRFELLPCNGFNIPENHERTRLYFTGIPKNMEEEEIITDMKGFLFPIAEVKDVILPSNWKEKCHLFIEFHDEISTCIVARVTKICEMHGNIMRSTFARKQLERPPGRQRPNGSSPGMSQVNKKLPVRRSPPSVKSTEETTQKPIIKSTPKTTIIKTTTPKTTKTTPKTTTPKTTTPKTTTSKTTTPKPTQQNPQNDVWTKVGKAGKVNNIDNPYAELSSDLN